MNKILFLDFDGVLNSVERARNNIPFSEFIPECVSFIQYLACQGVQVVVSSSWRRGKTRAQLGEILGVAIRGVTPAFAETGVTRGMEIKCWLDSNDELSSNYCIIDDYDDMLPEQKGRFVNTDCETGMKNIDMAKVCEILNVCLPNVKDHRVSGNISPCNTINPMSGTPVYRLVRFVFNHL